MAVSERIGGREGTYALSCSIISCLEQLYVRIVVGELKRIGQVDGGDKDCHILKKVMGRGMDKKVLHA